MLLSDAKCRTALPTAKVRKLSDGEGLQLWIHPNGAKLWRLAYRFAGKQKTLAIGPYPRVTLARARKAREDAKLVLLDGLDPTAEKKSKALEQRNAVTFKLVADEYLAKLKREGRAVATLSKTEWLLTFANEGFGNQPIKAITAPLILDVLRHLEDRELYESARRLRSTVGAVFRYAIATARAEMDPTQALRGALTQVAATPRPAVTSPEELGALLRAIDSFDGQPVTRYALQLMALLFPRPGELRAAEWTEFDFERSVWIIPAARTKMRRNHRVPLSTQAVATLNSLRKISGKAKLLFPGTRVITRCISDNTMNAALRRLGYAKDEATAHGFRATAATLLNESGKWHPDAIERQLAHIERNQVRAAYTRGEYWAERVAMMQWWADELDQLRQLPHGGQD